MSLRITWEGDRGVGDIQRDRTLQGLHSTWACRAPNSRLWGQIEEALSEVRLRETAPRENGKKETVVWFVVG